MGCYQGTFQRVEMKYILSEEKYELLRELLQDRMREDEYGRITICNIYFDTPDHRLICTSLEKPVYKEKLRLRSYKTPHPGDTVFIELKKKYKGIVYKRREKLELSLAEKYLYEHNPVGESTQITKEIDWFIRSYQNLRPAMYISYDRIALYGADTPELRITFDSNLLWREEELWLGSGIWGNEILQEGQRLMEIKIPGTMPLWLAHSLDQLQLYPSSFSKYGKAYLASEQQRIMMKRKGEKKYA